MKDSELVGASPLIHARVTGLLGLLVLACGSFAAFVASRLIVRDDIGATAGNLIASENLFRIGIVSSLLMMIAWLFYALMLYRLLRPVSMNAAAAMVALVVVSVPIYMLNQVNQFAVLSSAAGSLHEQVKFFLELSRFGNLVAALFFGLWLFPLGLLVFRSGFLPRVLGVLLMVGTFGYLILFVQAFLFPGHERTLWSNPFLAVTHVAELALLLWLLIKGVNVERWHKCVRP